MATKKINTTTKKGRREFANSAKWLPYVQKEFGWLVNIYETNPEVANIIRSTYINESPDEEIFKQITNSKWRTSLQDGEYEYIKGTSTNNATYMARVAARETAVSNAAKNLGYQLTPESVKEIAANSLKGNYDNAALNEAIGKSVADQAKTPTGAQAPDAPTTTLRTGQDAATIKTTAKKYGLSLSDAQVEGYVQATLTGGMSDQQIIDQFRNQSKALYPSVATLLDSGDLDSSVGSYKQIAANVLGIDVAQVDLTQDKFRPLLTYQDPKNGEARLMNSTEWNRYLRTLPDWQKTSEASKKNDDLIKTIDKVFGKVR
jgi:hypothetical protein